MANRKASEAAEKYLESRYLRDLNGWIFYAMRNGRPLAEAAHGLARRTQVGDLSSLTYGARTIVHLASVSKLICGVAVLRFLEEWNEIAQHLQNNGGPHLYTGPARPGDEKLIEAVCHWGDAISLDTPIFPFLKPHLRWSALSGGVGSLPNGDPPSTTGLGVEHITIRQLLTHTSGLRDNYYSAGLTALGLSWNEIKQEVTMAGKARFDLVKDCAAILASDVVAKVNSYCNDAFTLLGALIQFNSGMTYEDWVNRKLKPDARFADIARHPVDLARAAKYYGANDGADVGGVFHPDYAAFSACGGYYASAHAICDWLDAVMQKEVFNGRPILVEPRPLMDFRLGCDGFDFGPLQGLAKNGGTAVGVMLVPGTAPVMAGSTNVRVCYLKGHGKDRFTAFVQTNEPADADPMLVNGLMGIREYLYTPTAMPWVPPELTAHGGLRAKRWRSVSGDVAALRFTPAVESAVNVAGEIADRTNLLSGATIPFALTDLQTVELTGVLTLPAGEYRLRISSDDGSLLYLDDVLILDDDGNHPLKSDVSRWRTFSAAGKKLKVIWYNSGGGAGLYLESNKRPDLAWHAIPAACFSTPAVTLQPPTP